jgi:hypothetical protein
MSSSPENAAEHTHTKPVSNLTYLHKHQPKPGKQHDSPHSRGRNSSRHELGRRHRAGERVTRIYPRQVYVTVLHPHPACDSPPTEQPLPRLQSASRPPLHPQTTMLPLRPCCRLLVPRETRPPSTPPSGPSRSPSFPSKALQVMAA